MACGNLTDEDIATLWIPAFDTSNPKARFPGFKPREEMLRAGSRKSPKSKPLPCDIIWKVDVQVLLRDGTTIYLDAFMPARHVDTKMPTIVAWSPYGKQGGLSLLEDFPDRMGVNESDLSGYQKWEGPDPAYWCAKGYVVINSEARGSGASEGNILSFGEQEAQDAFDVIEWLANQPWSNGKVGLAGNSWLAISQWFIAAARPPHLAAIAPWEGCTDVYRHHAAIGGILDVGFMESIFPMLAGKGRVEDLPGMIQKYPLFNAYWASKCARLRNIDIPAYVVASWTNPIHTPGTFEGWSELPGNDKWLRVHSSHEWYDFYKNQDDLARFFDRYLKNENNGWEATPRIRVSLLNDGQENARSIELESLPSQENKRIYVDAGSGKLADGAVEKGAFKTVDLRKTGGLKLNYVFTQRTALIGPIKLKLFLSVVDGGDADIFVKAVPLNKNGKARVFRTAPIKGLLARAMTAFLFLSKNSLARHFFYDGAWGKLRLSHRGCQEGAAHAFTIEYDHDKTVPVGKDQIVEVDLILTPVGLQFEAGDALQLVISGRDSSPLPSGKRKKPETVNASRELKLYDGEGHSSYMELPVADLKTIRLV